MSVAPVVYPAEVGAVGVHHEERPSQLAVRRCGVVSHEGDQATVGRDVQIGDGVVGVGPGPEPGRSGCQIGYVSGGDIDVNRVLYVFKPHIPVPVDGLFGHQGVHVLGLVEVRRFGEGWAIFMQNGQGDDVAIGSPLDADGA